MRFDGMPQRRVRIDEIDVAAADAALGQYTSGLQIGKNVRHRTLRDADLLREIAHAQIRLPCKCNQDMRVVA